MHIYTKLMFPLLAVFLLGACVGAGHLLLMNHVEASCRVGEDCESVGKLFIYRGVPASVAELKTSKGCLALALAEGEYQKLRSFQGQNFRVRGPAFAQTYAEEVTSYQLKDRWVATGICSASPIIYVTEITKLH